MTIEQAAAQSGPAWWRGRLYRQLALLVVGVPLALLLYEAGRVSLGENLHTLVPGRVYRCSQPSPALLHRLARDYGVRTVVNLRGNNKNVEWYGEELRTTCDLDMSLEDITFSAARYPPRDELRRLIEVLDQTEYPIVLHCKQGADRTGLAAVVYMLLYEGCSLDEALVHMAPRYGHIPLGRTQNLNAFFELYRQWLAEQVLPHSAANFRRWALHEYHGGHMTCAFESCRLPDRIAPHRAWHVHLRVRNTGSRTWHFSPLQNLGVHVAGTVHDLKSRECSYCSGGFLRAVVAPGEAIELTVPVKGFPPGEYLLMLSLTDPDMGLFFSVSGTQLERRITIAQD